MKKSETIFPVIPFFVSNDCRPSDYTNLAFPRFTSSTAGHELWV